MNDYFPVITIIIIVAVLLLCGVGIWFLVRARRKKPSELDLMEGHDFEYFCAELLRRRGFQEVEVTKGSGDYGIDILAEKEGVTYAIQCKCYSAPVGVKAVQEVIAGKAYYDCDRAMVITNSTFTPSAVELAKKSRVELWSDFGKDDLAWIDCIEDVSSMLED